MLTEIVAHKQRELAAIEKTVRIDAMRRLIEDLPPVRSLRTAMQSETRLSVVAEIKRRSPSRGDLAADVDVVERARTYETAGARGISVLTDRKYFSGSVIDLQAAAHAVRLPVLRKDFIIDEYQVYESRAIGADIILLIVAALRPDDLSRLCRLAQDLELETLVEIHNEQELDRAAGVDADIIGINNRDLGTFEVSLETTERLRPLLPDSACCLSESGIHSCEDMQRVAQAGADGVLIGESLMTAPDPAARIRELLGVSE